MWYVCCGVWSTQIFLASSSSFVTGIGKKITKRFINSLFIVNKFRTLLYILIVGKEY